MILRTSAPAPSIVEDEGKGGSSSSRSIVASATIAASAIDANTLRIEISGRPMSDVKTGAPLYRLIGLIGEGTYGVVHQALDPDMHYVALKTILLQQASEGIPSTALREIALLKELQHENIVRLDRVFATKSALTMAFEFADSDLKKYLDLHGPLSIQMSKYFLFQLLKGISHIHSLNILHRDLKPQNILLKAENYIKIADFGLAREFGIPVRAFTSEIVTLWYRPPEVLLGCDKYTTSLDLWSIGCIFGEMLCGQALFMGNSTTDQLEKIFTSLGAPTFRDAPLQSMPLWKNEYAVKYPRKEGVRHLIPHVDDKYAIDLLEKLLCYNFKERISAQAALHHPFFDSEGSSN